MIITKDLSVFIERRPILERIKFSVEEGQMVGIIGPNGSGKSTLLKTIANILKKDSGAIVIDDKEISTYKRKDLAKKISYVPQNIMIDFDFTAQEIVTMGRHIYQSRFSPTQESDITIVKQAMQMTNTWAFRDKSVHHLSGGQRQLVLIAKALAQDTPILLLDEPISALDINFQLDVLMLLQALATQGRTILIVLHDLDLAARFCEQLLLLDDGKIKAFGKPENVLIKDLLTSTYDVETSIDFNHITQSLTVTPIKKKDSLGGKQYV